MILVKIFLTRIFLKKAPTCSRGSIVYQKYKNNFGVGFKVGEIVKNDKKIHFCTDFLKLINQSFGIFYMLNFRILSQKFDFFIIPGVSRTFDPVL